MEGDGSSPSRRTINMKIIKNINLVLSEEELKSAIAAYITRVDTYGLSVWFKTNDCKFKFIEDDLLIEVEGFFEEQEL